MDPPPVLHPEAVQTVQQIQRPALVVVMGVSGSGKSTVGQQLSDDLHVPWRDGDDLHSQANILKMARGQALDDEDRLPWLHDIRSEAIRLTSREAVKTFRLYSANGQSIRNDLLRPTVVIACSALKRAYRDILRGTTGKEDRDAEHEGVQTYFVYLKGARELLIQRMQQRTGHFMKVSMLDSQLGTLEEPAADEDLYGGVIVIDISQSKEDVRRRAAQAVRNHVGL